MHELEGVFDQPLELPQSVPLSLHGDTMEIPWSFLGQFHDCFHRWSLEALRNPMLRSCTTLPVIALCLSLAI